jgi:hypothetical protein
MSRFVSNVCPFDPEQNRLTPKQNYEGELETPTGGDRAVAFLSWFTIFLRSLIPPAEQTAEESLLLCLLLTTTTTTTTTRRRRRYGSQTLEHLCLSVFERVFGASSALVFGFWISSSPHHHLIRPTTPGTQLCDLLSIRSNNIVGSA